MIRAPSSRAAALLRGGSSRSWRRLPLGRRFRSPRIRAAWAEGGREKLRRQLEPGGQRGGPWPHRPHWIHPSCGWSSHPVDAAPQWAAAPRLRRLQMLQRPGGIKHIRDERIFGKGSSPSLSLLRKLTFAKNSGIACGAGLEPDSCLLRPCPAPNRRALLSFGIFRR